jgi:two-component sensor histidine kinase
VTNAIKHGADGGEPVSVKLEGSRERCRLVVRNGGTLPEGYDRATGFGMKMISSMVTQLNGKLEVSSANGETEFAVSFRPDTVQRPMYDSSGRRDARSGEVSNTGA